jgi:hypothetical protein
LNGVTTGERTPVMRSGVLTIAPPSNDRWLTARYGSTLAVGRGPD